MLLHKIRHYFLFGLFSIPISLQNNDLVKNILFIRMKGSTVAVVAWMN